MNMTKIQKELAALPDSVKGLFSSLFHDVETFYTVVYLIVRNEHVVEQEKPERYEERLQVIRAVRSRVENLVSSFGLEGKEMVADIAGDYFEDYVNYREPEITMTNEEFLGYIRKISRD